MKYVRYALGLAAILIAWAGHGFAAFAAPLRVLEDHYPRAFFFRHSEGLAASGRLSFEEWERQFNGLMGIMGKALEEEVPGRSTNVAFFTQFKQRHPEQVVLLHCNGNSRDPRWESDRFFAGHWLYYNGATITAKIAAEEGESVLHVSDAALFEVNTGRYRDAKDDLGLCRLGPDGKPDWTYAEQVQLIAVDRKANTITVRRGCYGTKPLAFAAGKSYAAAHCTEGPWGRKSNLLWFYNYSTVAPRDAQGRTCTEVWVQQRAAWLGKPLGPAIRLASRQPDLFQGAGRPLSRPSGTLSPSDGERDGGRALRGTLSPSDGERGSRFMEKFESTDARIERDGQSIKLSSTDPAAREFRVRLKDVPCAGPDLFISLSARAQPMNGHPIEMARRLHVGVTSSGEVLTRPDPAPVTGMMLRDGRELPIDPETGAVVRLQAVVLDDGTRSAWHVHPPYKTRARGGTFWERQVRVPAGGALEFHTGLSKNGAAKGDGVTFIVQVAAERDGKSGPFQEIFRAHERLSRWAHHTVPLDQWAGQPVRLRFLSDCGPNNNVTADQSYWGDVRIASAGALAAAATPPVNFMTWMNEKEFTSGFYFNDIRSPQVDLELVVESAEPVWLTGITAHAHPDVMWREFEHGVVLANPSPRPHTFELAKLFPNQRFRRIQGSADQDPKTNNGQAAGARVTLGPQDALFLARETPPRIGRRE